MVVATPIDAGKKTRAGVVDLAVNEDEIEVYADPSCPFAHVGLRRLVARRAGLGLEHSRFAVRPWPLEIVNGAPLDPHAVAVKVAALRAQVAPTMFAGFDPDRSPDSWLPVMAMEILANERGVDVGESFSLAVRDAHFERGLRLEGEALAAIAEDHGLPMVDSVSAGELVRASWHAGMARGVKGSPHFFTTDGDFFCPSLQIGHDGDDLVIRADAEAFDRTVLARR